MRKGLILISVILFLGFLALAISKVETGHNEYFGERDFIAFYTGATLAFKNPYKIEAVKKLQDELKPGTDKLQYFFNPPWSLLILRNLTLFDFNSSRILFLFLGLISIVLAAYCWSCFLNISFTWSLLIASTFMPFQYNIMVGQLTLPIFASLSLGILFVSRGRYLLGSIFFLPCLIKPHLFLAMVLLFRIYPRRFVLNLIWVSLIYLIVSYIIYPNAYLAWIQDSFVPITWQSSSLLPFLMMLGDFPVRGVIASLCFISFISGLIIPIKNERRAVAVALYFTVFFAPYSFPYDFSLAFPLLLLATPESTLGKITQLGITSMTSNIIGLFSIIIMWQVFVLWIIGIFYIIVYKWEQFFTPLQNHYQKD